MKKQIAVFPGSFDPFHIGHLDILLKANDVFDEVIVAVGINPQKEKKINRVETIRKQIPGFRVEEFEGFITNYIHELEEGSDDVITIVRGLRNGNDLAYEMNYLQVLKDLKPDTRMVFLPCDVRLGHVSSSMVRDMERIQKGSGSEYLAKAPMIEKLGPGVSSKEL